MEPNPIPPSSLMFSTVAGAPLLFPAPTIAEAENHLVPPANPFAQAQQAPQHPPYADMICAAIAALKEPDGSSKQAIAKYIERTYPGLPTSHPALLTHNLNRLKDSGHLVMVKKSYKLFRSDDATSASATANANAPSQLEPQPTTQARGRGRPPKIKTQQPVAPQIPPPQQEQSQMPQPQFQFQQQILMANTQHQFTDPVLVALGLVDEPAAAPRSSPGRPRKNAGPMDVTGEVGSASTGRKRGRPPGSKGRKAGRPPKPTPVSPVSNGSKRRPGRPRKFPLQPHSQAIPFDPATVPFSEPPNEATTPKVEAMPAPSVPDASLTRRRGRPRKYPVGMSAVPVATAGPILGSGRGHGSGRGRGRGHGRGVASGLKSSTGRPVGRPRKYPVVATHVSNGGELSRKLEHFQAKVKEAFDVLKPNFICDESSSAAIRALNDLEMLATLDLNAPFIDEATQQPPVPASSQVPLQPDSYLNLQ